jgi:XTP/dITP diphosphohydrolase/tetrapyrrole methylase family protein/MazG family protein
MLAEAVWKQVEKKNLPTAGVVDAGRVGELSADLDEATLGRALFELCAAARRRGFDAEGALRRESDRVMRAVEAQVAATPAGCEV